MMQLNKPNDFQGEPGIVLVVDISVLAHQLMHRVNGKYESKLLREPDWPWIQYIQACTHSLVSGWLQYADESAVPIKAVLGLADLKYEPPRSGYWRHTHLATKYNYKGYKGGRKAYYPDTLQAVKNTIRAEISAFGAVLCKEGYEADDWAGYLCRVLPDEKLVLLTVDTDWLGLISPNCIWLDMMQHEPRLRYDLASLNAWSSSKLKTVFEKPSDIWAHKAKFGDASDNLPKGMGAIEVISLLEPEPEYDLLNVVGTLVGRTALAKAVCNRQNAKVEKAAAVFKNSNTWPTHTVIRLPNGLCDFGVVPF